MLFRQVATNLRTRRLLRVNVYRGNAFSSYVRVLYSQWKKQQNKTKQTKKDEYVQLRDHVLQVCGLKPAVQEVKKTPVAPLPPLRVKAKTSKPNPKYTFGQGKSSTHFSDVQF
ncbi:hypothetical protein AGDE_12523 [Angomonas deanei]|uniref:Uncharacterized protein n=1 Tax=Angomonas deanei TaxID=59799 RepID=A0A7G2CBH6_9TRYP|nr:hypothetical protein AGDE_12523 [Angomonas deanei]CAD2217128.1 hypothetical protein, conserved [Angomonas deanei]|eukprot:EPY24080.1 hypothetical protein AGDE_12523 [Angomonas deanei]